MGRHCSAVLLEAVGFDSGLLFCREGLGWCLGPAQGVVRGAWELAGTLPGRQQLASSETDQTP